MFIIEHLLRKRIRLRTGYSTFVITMKDSNKMTCLRGFVLVALMSSQLAALAQQGMILRVGKEEEVKAAKSRPLLLMLVEENPRILSLYARKPRDRDNYKEAVKRINEGLQTAVTKYWTFTAQPEVKSKAEIDKLKGEKNKSYCVISADYLIFQNYQTRTNADDPNTSRRYLAALNEVISVWLDVIENVGKPNPVYFQNTPNLYPSDADMAIVMMIMQNALQDRMEGKSRQEFWDQVGRNKSMLPTKTLLFDKEMIKLTEDEIKGVYPHPFKVVEYAVIEKAILDRDPDVGIVQVVPMLEEQLAFANMIVNASDGKIMAYYAPIQPPKPGIPDIRIGEKHLKAFAK